MTSHKQIVIILVLLSSLNYAQIKIHKYLTTEDGLISNRIICMLEDSRGYIWFGTDNGVSRWDGKNFVNFRKNDGLASSHIEDIKEGKDGKIYLATYGKGLTIIDNDSIYTINETNGLISNWVTSILVRKNGEVIVGAEKGKISVIRNKKIYNWQGETGFRNNSVKTLFEADDSTLYLGSHKLYKYSNKILSEYSHSTSDSIYITIRIINAIEKDRNGKIIVGSRGGIFELENDRLKKIIINEHEESFPSGAIKPAKDGRTYFGSDKGILIRNGNSFENLTKENGLSDNVVWSILEDSKGTLYFGTRDHGVNIYHPGRLDTYLPDVLANKSVQAIYKDSLNNIYFGTTEGLIINENESNFSNTILNGKRINSILFSEGQLLIGTRSGLELNRSNKLINFRPFDDPGGVNNVWSIIQNYNDNFLIGFQGGLFEFEDNSLKKIKTLKGHNQFIQDVLVLKDSSLVVGTHGNGINVYKNNKHKIYNSDNGLSDNIVNSLYETIDNTLLVGTNQGGLNIIENGIIVNVFDVTNGLTSNTIMDINEDEENNIYLSTANGLNVLSNWRDSLFVRTIMNKDGLVSNSCNRNATFIDDKGIIWIGTSNGVTKYNPKADKPITSPPKVYLTGLEIFNKKYPLEKFRNSKQLEYDQNYLKFIFTGINLSAPDKILYKYKLNGVDRNWVEGRNNYANYTSLHKGDYTFEVKARNEWGYWSKPESVAFVINPAWWETWWFRLAVISVLGFLLWLAFQYRLNYLLKLERLRTKIASDLHDDVGSLLTQISINVDSLSYTKDENKRKEKRKFIGEKSKEVINMMSDVIWSIDSRNDTMESLVDRIQNFAQTFAEQKDVSLEFVNEINVMQKSLKIDFRQNVMMIAKEAINNSIKYSDCTKIKVVLSNKNNQFEMIISDDGKGIDFKNIKRGNGLKNMKMRAELINAKIDFANKDGCIVHLVKQKL